MSAATITAPVTTGKSWTQATRVLLVSLAVVALLALSFVIGRATVSTAKSVPAIAPTAGVSSGGAATSASVCHMGRPC